MNVDRAAQIASITSHPAWEHLVADVEETVESYSVSLAKAMLATGKPFDNFEYKRGFLAGLKHFARYPDTATAVLKKDAAKQQETHE